MSSTFKDYFSLFALPVQYRIDREDLKRRFETLIAKTHPDRFATATEVEKRIAVQVTEMINAAYATLEDDFERAVYMCQMKGMDPKARSVLDADFLEKQMTFFEAIEALSQDSKAPERLALQNEIDHEASCAKEAIAQNFAAGDDKGALYATQALGFWLKLRAKLN